MRVLTLFPLTMILSVSYGPAIGKPAGFDEATADFNNHQYSQALSKFQAIERTNQEDALTHYYSGLCYQYLSQMTAAQQEYSWVADHTADPALRANAQQALQGLADWSSHRSYAGQGNNFQSQPILTNQNATDSPDRDPRAPNHHGRAARFPLVSEKKLQNEERAAERAAEKQDQADERWAEKQARSAARSSKK